MSIQNRIIATGLASLLAVNTVSSALAQDEKAAPKPLTPLAKEILSQSQNDQSTMSEIRPKNVRQLTEVLEAPRTPESIDKADKLIKTGNDHFNRGEFQDALLRWQEAYGMSIEMKYTHGQGQALIGMCKVYLTQGKWVKARHLGENAVEVLSAINDEVQLGKARIALAQAYFGLDNPLWALRQLDLAMKHLLNRPETDSNEAASLMRLAGALALRFNKLKEAIRYFQESAKYSAQGNNLPEALTMHCKIAGLLSELGFYVASLEEAHKAIAVAKRSKNDRAMISALASLANAQYVLGEFPEANASYKEAYRLAGKYDESVLDKEGKANLLMGYAFSQIAVGEEEIAEKILGSIVPYFERSGKTYPHAECLNALGVMHANAGDSFNAVSYFEKALDLQGLIKPTRVRMQIMILCNIAAVEYRVGKYRDAVNHLRTVLPILQKNPKDYHVIRTRLYVSLAEVAHKLGDTENSQKYLDVALKLGKETSDDMAMWRALTVQAQLQLENKEEDDAKETLIEALSHFRSPQAGNFPSAEFLRFMSTRREYGQQLVALLASQGLAEQALLIAEQLKEEDFISGWLREGGEVKKAHKDVFDDLTRERAHLNAAETNIKPSDLTKEWTTWLTRFSALAREDKAIARFIAPYPTTVREIVETASKNKITFLDYLIGEKSSVVFTVDPAGRISATVLPIGEAALTKQVGSILAGAINPAEMQEAEKTVLKTLYEELLPQSVRSFLPVSDDRQIVIIPDGVLFNLPFAALIDENDKFLVENHLLTMVSTMREAFDRTAPSTSQLSILVATNQNANNEQNEVNEISTAVRPDPVFTIPANGLQLGDLEKEVQGKAVLHLASPISISDQDPIDSKIPFSTFAPPPLAVDVAELSGGEKTKPIEQPKVAQGAVARNLFELSLPSDLVVLSGTSVSGARFGGKAVKVFSRGLQYAGARNVMMSLWSQPGAAHNIELANFYKNKKSGMNDAQSLRQAQLLSLSNDRRPKSWAAFQLFGVDM